MNLSYIHGFNSGVNSSTSKALKQIFPEIKICSYNTYDKFYSNYTNLYHQVKNSDIIIGSSISGFFAGLLANNLKLSSVMINPVLYPYKFLRQFLSQNTSFEEVLKSYKSQTIPKNSLGNIIILSEQDTFVKSHDICKYFQGYAQIIKVSGGSHQLNISSIKNIKEMIEHLYNEV